MATFLATIGQIFVRVVGMYGIDTRALVREGGIDPATSLDVNARLPSSLADLFASRAAALIPDPAFALRAARCWHPSNLGALGYAWLSSSTLRTALRRLERYGHILGEKATMQLRESRDGLWFVYDHAREDQLLNAIGADFAMSVVLDMCRMNYGSFLMPVEVELCRRRPNDPEPWKRFFGCPIRFGASEDSLLLSQRAASKVLPTANRQIAATLDEILTRQLAELDRTDIAARCKAVLLDQLASGEISEEEMAKELSMSRRTLQRKLAGLGTSYQKLVDDTRQDLALRYLDDTRKSVTDVTFQLGFSSQSAFTRAFRRWTGTSPTGYRAQRRSSIAPAGRYSATLAR